MPASLLRQRPLTLVLHRCSAYHFAVNGYSCHVNSTKAVTKAKPAEHPLGQRYLSWVEQEIRQCDQRIAELGRERQELEQLREQAMLSVSGDVPAPRARTAVKRAGAMRTAAKRTTAKHTAAKRSSVPAPAAPKARARRGSVTVMQAMLDMMSKDPSKVWRAGELEQATGLTGVVTNLHRAAKRGLVEKVGTGQYRAASAGRARRGVKSGG